MDSSSVRTARLGWLGEFSRYQWSVFLIAWIGWALDATDFGLFSIVLRPALTELLGGQPTVAQLGKVGGYLSMVGLLGWAFGGFIFGLIAGQVSTLVGPYGGRYVFFVGVAPALLLVFFRRGLAEPAHFHAVRERREAVKSAGAAASAEDKAFMRFVPAQLFTRDNRFAT